MPDPLSDRTARLIACNHDLLAKAAEACQQTRQIITQAAVNRIKSDEIRHRRSRLPLAVLPAADDPEG